jgi:hypothetical protein
MSTGVILLSMKSASVPSGGSGNAAPGAIFLESSAGVGTNKPTFAQDAWAFDAAVDEHLLWAFLMPISIVGGGSIRLKYRMASAISGGVVWKAAIKGTNDGADDDSALAFPSPVTVVSAVPTTLGWVAEAIIPGVGYGTAGMKHILFIGRDADNGSDTAAGDAYLLAANYEYTPG